MNYYRPDMLSITNRGKRPEIRGAFAVECSTALKVGGCSVTYASQASCPQDCPFLNNGCMAEAGNMRIHASKLYDPHQQPMDVTRNEAQHIDWLTGQRPCRLHEVGDCTTDPQAEVLAEAAERYYGKFKQECFTYTHSWKKVSRKSWGRISVLASTESIDDAIAAMKMGYAASMVVSNPLPTAPRALKLSSGETLVPCPHEAGLADCINCALCMNDKHLLANKMVIVFTAHGSGRKKILASLRQLQSKQTGE